MKRSRMVGKIRYAGYLLIIMQGLVIALLAIFLLNQQYMDVWRTYPQNNESMTVYLKNVPDDKQRDTQNFLLTSAKEQGLFISRMDLLLDNSGGMDGYKFGVYGNTDEPSAELSFLNERILTAADLKTLISSDDPNSTLGVETGSIYSIGDIPGFRFYEHIVLKNLPGLFQDSQTVNGAYVILGLESTEAQSRFLQGLADASGLQAEGLLEADSGNVANNRVMQDVLLAFLAAQIFLNVVFFLVVVMKNLSKQGKLALLGWPRTAFAKEVLGGFFFFSAAVIPVLMLGNSLIAGWEGFSFILLGYYLMAACMNVLVVLLELMISAIVIVIIKPLDAIRGRIPKRTLYALGILAYLVISGGLIFCGAYVDQPIAAISDNARLAKQWEAVSEYQILSDISIGQDSTSFSGGSKELDQDLYNWYSSIADKKGVYLIQTQYYDSEILAVWQNNQTYSATPAKPLWLFTMSPNYLADLGMALDADTLEAAKGGARVYLIPAGKSDEEKEHISKWLQEADTRSLSDGDIQTIFTKKPTFCFVEYEPDQAFFTWTTDKQNSMEASAPVIYVATPQNMKYTETESLKASGFNGYIKFADADAAVFCTKADMLSDFHLTDNELRFTDVHNYIDGLQKEMSTTLMWFGLVFLMLLLILTGLLVTLAAVFRVANQERINVKKFLGFSFLQMYSRPMLLLSVLIVLELAAMLIMGSKFGLLLVMIVSVIQLVIFIRYMAHNELKNVLADFKGE